MSNSADRPAASPAVRYVRVGENADGQRVDNFLIRTLKGVPRTRIYRLLRTGQVRVNKGRVKPSRKLVVGDTIRIPPVRIGARGIPIVAERVAEKINNSIIYEDERLLVLNKPSGLAVHGGSGVSLGAIEALRAMREHSEGLELVHRLDRDTSGCLMVAKRRSALRRLQELQREGRIGKVYSALLSGHSPISGFDIDAPLRKNTLRGGERVVCVDTTGKSSLTRFKVLEQFADSMLVEAHLYTGRTHQIRVHAAHAGFPLLGDPKYGDDKANERYRARGLNRLFLHALKLRIPIDEDGPAIELVAPLPSVLSRLLSEIRGIT